MHYFVYLTHLLNQYSYWGIFFIMALGGYIIFVPEEIFLIAIAYGAALGHYNIYTAYMFALAGSIASDTVVYLLARQGNVLIHRLKNKIRLKTVDRYECAIARNAGKTIFGLRFVAGLRLLGPALAGLGGVRFWKFQFYNFCALFIIVTVFLFGSYHFHANIGYIIDKIGFIRHIVSALALPVIVALVILYVRDAYYTERKLIQKRNKS